MTAKQIIYHEHARDKIRRGMDALADAVKVTLGPRGRTVVIGREFGAPPVVNSGGVVSHCMVNEGLKRLGAGGAQAF
jgi:chaperonin GroEL